MNDTDKNQTTDNGQNAYCSICGRSEKDAGPLLMIPQGQIPGMPPLPGGVFRVCGECMQNVMNMFSGMGLPNFMTDPNLAGLFGMQGAPAGGQNETAAEAKSEDAGPEVIFAGESEDGGDKDEKKEKKGPSVSFVNLGSIFDGMGIPGMQQRRPAKKKKDTPPPVFSIDNMPAPHIIKAKLDEYVVGQEQAKKAMSVAVYNHYKRVRTGHMDDIEIEKSNILMIGPTGCGKTYLVKTLARLLDVPLAIADATSLTEAGYIGDDIESVVSKLLDAADNDIEKAEKGIIFIDEIDKIAKKSNSTTRDVNGESVQQGMLKLLEGAEVEVPVGAANKNAMVPMAMVDTRNILFIVGGAFPNLENIIKERLTKRSGFGYNAELKDRFDEDKNLLARVQTEDLRAFGFIPEFIGRLPVVCTLKGLDVDMLAKILTEPRNAITKQYQKLLELDEVRLEFDEAALKAIAEKAIKRETGARALRAIIEEIMMDIMYEVPKDDSIGKVTITEDYVNGKGAPLIEIRTVAKPELPAPTPEV